MNFKIVYNTTAIGRSFMMSVQDAAVHGGGRHLLAVNDEKTLQGNVNTS